MKLKRPHPLTFAKRYWPHAAFYREQRDVIVGIRDDTETVIVSANKMGKDYVSAYICLSFFLCPQMYFPDSYVRYVESTRKSPEQEDWQIHTRRIITTSVDGDQLRNLWGEMSRFIASCKAPLTDAKGGPLRINMRDISLAAERLESGQEPLNYLIGRVSATGEGMSGAHAAYNLMVIDEASGSDDMIYDFAQGWAKKFLIFGNPRPTSNFYRRMVERGNLDLKLGAA